MIPKSIFSVNSDGKIKNNQVYDVQYNDNCITIIEPAVNLFNVVEGLSGSEKQPVAKFLSCALPSYDRFCKGHSEAERCSLKNI